MTSVIEQTAVRPEVVAVDKKMIRAQGPLWHQSDRAEGHIPEELRGVDRDSSWSVSAYRQWVQGCRSLTSLRPFAKPPTGIGRSSADTLKS